MTFSRHWIERFDAVHEPLVSNCVAAGSSDGAAFLLALGAAVLLSRSIVLPVQALQDGILRFAEGDRIDLGGEILGDADHDAGLAVQRVVRCETN